MIRSVDVRILNIFSSIDVHTTMPDGEPSGR